MKEKNISKMIKKIEVHGLFKAFNHTIIFKQENITLMLGENGLGKTIILKMIKSFFSRDFYELLNIQFNKFIVYFSNSEKVEISQTEDRKGNKILKINYHIKTRKTPINYQISIKEEKDRTISRHGIRGRFYPNELHYLIQKYIPFPIERIAPDRWINHSDNILYTTNEIINVYSKFLPFNIREQFDKPIPQKLIDLTNSVKVKLIETQRLLTKTKVEEEEYKSSVIKYSQELVENIKNTSVKATNLASRLDRSYPNRVMKNITQKSKFSDSDLKVGLTDLNKRREFLNKVGLIDTERESLEQITDAIQQQTGKNKGLLKDVLQIYLEDSNQKLTIYDDIANRINLLISIINKRFLGV